MAEIHWITDSSRHVLSFQPDSSIRAQWLWLTYSFLYSVFVGHLLYISSSFSSYIFRAFFELLLIWKGFWTIPSAEDSTVYIIPFNCAPGAGCTMTLSHLCYIFLSCQSYRPKDDKDERHHALSSVLTGPGCCGNELVAQELAQNPWRGQSPKCLRAGGEQGRHWGGGLLTSVRSVKRAVHVKNPKRLCQRRRGQHEGEPRKHQVELEKALRLTLERQVIFL